MGAMVPVGTSTKASPRSWSGKAASIAHGSNPIAACLADGVKDVALSPARRTGTVLGDVERASQPPVVRA